MSAVIEPWGKSLESALRVEGQVVGSVQQVKKSNGEIDLYRIYLNRPSAVSLSCYLVHTVTSQDALQAYLDSFQGMDTVHRLRKSMAFQCADARCKEIERELEERGTSWGATDVTFYGDMVDLGGLMVGAVNHRKGLIELYVHRVAPNPLGKLTEPVVVKEFYTTLTARASIEAFARMIFSDKQIFRNEIAWALTSY
jgi:hypothetical protein